jgi:hypothetical protein
MDMRKLAATTTAGIDALIFPPYVEFDESVCDSWLMDYKPTDIVAKVDDATFSIKDGSVHAVIEFQCGG